MLPARIQLLVGGTLLAVVLVVANILDLAARNQSIATRLTRLDEEFCLRTRSEFFDAGYFIDPEDRLLSEELPNDDYSDGGVYLFGTSNVRVATKFWELNGSERNLIHNYAISKSSHTQQFLFLQYLINKRGLLVAGGDKTLVIFGVGYQDARYDPDGYFAQLWKRHGMYSYDEKTGISDVHVNRVWHFIDYERTRVAGFLSRLSEAANQELHMIIYRRGEPSKKHNAAYYNMRRRAFMGPNWETEMPQQVDELIGTIDYLRSLHVHVAIVFMPQGTWEDNLPFERAYVKLVNDRCKGKNIAIYDWSRMLPDSEFEDSAHPNAEGQERLQRAFLSLSRTFLVSTHVLSPGSLAGNTTAQTISLGLNDTRSVSR